MHAESVIKNLPSLRIKHLKKQRNLNTTEKLAKRYMYLISKLSKTKRFNRTGLQVYCVIISGSQLRVV